MKNGHPNRLVSEAVDKADGLGVDFSNYDTNSDGTIDHLILIHTGYGQESHSSDTDRIWSHYSGIYKTS